MTDEMAKELGESMRLASERGKALQAVLDGLKPTTRETGLVRTKLQEAIFWNNQEKSRIHAALSKNTNPDLDQL